MARRWLIGASLRRATLVAPDGQAVSSTVRTWPGNPGMYWLVCPVAGSGRLTHWPLMTRRLPPPLVPVTLNQAKRGMGGPPVPPGSEETIGTYMRRGGRPLASSQVWGMTWYWPLPMLWRSELIWLLPGGIWLTTVAEG